MNINKINEFILTSDSDVYKNKIDTDSTSTYDILLCFIGVASVISMLLLCLHIFSVPLMLSITAGIIFTAVFVVLKKIQLHDIRFFPIFFVIIIIFTVIFRIGSFTHYQGGQDQGLYVSMSETIVRDNGINFYDSFGASLPMDKEIIDNYNKLTTVNDTNYINNLPGVISVDGSRSFNQIVFYPLSSVWMAVFKFIFGMGNHGLAIKFFSILIVIGVYLLTLELTAYNYKTALIACLLASLNPAFVFFSKFPVSETVAMAFSINGFYFLSRAVNCNNKNSKIFFYVTSAILLGMFNFIRMSFILYLPTLAIILITPFIFNDKRRHQKHIFIYILGVLGLFVCSWLWYYFYQPGLFKPMVNIVFIPFLKKYRYILISAFFIFIVIFFFVFFFVKKYKEKIDKFANNIAEKAECFLPYFRILIIAFSAFRMVQLCTKGFIDSGGFTHLNGNEFFNFKLSSLYRLIQIISPFLFILFFLPPILKIKFNRVQTLLIFTISVIWAAVQIDRWCTLHIYYYTRYIVSDMLLYSIVLVSIILGKMMERKAIYKNYAVFIIISAVLYSSIFSGVQIGKAETEITELFQSVDKKVLPNDVILSSAGLAINTPIKCYFNKPLYHLDGGDNELNTRIINKFWDYAGNKYSNIYLLTPDDYSWNPEKYGLELIDRFEYKYGFFNNTVSYEIPPDKTEVRNIRQLLLPLKYRERIRIVHLYKLVGYYKPALILLPVPMVMPTEIGDSIFTSGLYDHHTRNEVRNSRNNNGYLESYSNEENYLVFGPFQNANSGLYRIEYMLELPEYDTDMELALIGVLAQAGEILIDKATIFYGDENPTIEVELDMDYSGFEIRLKTYVPGVVFKGYTVTKLK
jgi:hypothetical protein